MRHEPQRIGLNLDPCGSVEVEALLAACLHHGIPIKKEDLDEVVASSEKERFAFSDDGSRIRANQGHSIEVSLGYPAQTPPPRLLYGTASRFFERIRKEGLHKRERLDVHLSPDAETAGKVGQRHGKPVILTIRAEEMHGRGSKFAVSENGVWLTAHVPVEFIEFPD